MTVAGGEQVFKVGSSPLVETLGDFLKEVALENRIFKVFFYLASLHSTWDFSSLTRDQTCPLCIGSVYF